MRAILLAALVALATTWQPTPGARFVFRELHMGMEVRITLFAPDATTARSAADAAFREIIRLEEIFSDWRVTSEVRRLTMASGWTPLSPELRDVLVTAQRVAVRSGGAFDPTVGPLVGVWRAARASRRLPTSADIARARGRTGYQFLVVDSAGQRARLLRDSMQLDLSAVAKGYIVQRASVAAGTNSIMIEAGGDIVVRGPPPGRGGWRIDAPTASAALQRRASSIVQTSMATSGPGAQATRIGGQRYSHVIDPRDGTALTTRRTATVIHEDGALADALATALTVLSPREGRRLLSSFGLDSSQASVR